jgi:hypothetical protein
MNVYNSYASTFRVFIEFQSQLVLTISTLPYQVLLEPRDKVCEGDIATTTRTLATGTKNDMFTSRIVKQHSNEDNLTHG